MASGQTSNYGLNQWAAEDKVMRTEFNEDNAKIDAALKNFGNCHIVTGSYIGSGEYGTGIYATALDFAETLGKAPELLIVRCSDSSPSGLVLLKGMTTTFYTLSHSWSSAYFLDLNWTATGVSWTGDSTAAQHSEKGKIYLYVAFG
ncbi:hypothetical protein DWX58_04665 [Pseudoflavonifractor sp. AF19-9AC]|uniref:hypothetical protein n=1 Tax=Pseudoflavonifractor sp. AF19-9AC TaxID=2292244 RepID=UPI000E4E8BB7|nr:hypothetical protein [Pseudoflavonifractor sp. AF19-9AC]RHR10681.1 hypothetical protein DWX58_04665 [Pseudoflavonifractor sp. AF19-9AC]